MSNEKNSKVKPEFNPNDRLTWQPESKIEISGWEFYAITHALSAFETAIMVKNTILARMAQDGTAKRIVPEAVEEVPSPVELKVVPKDEPEEK